MNSTEREIYDKYAYNKTHIYLVYEEFERRVNSNENEYDGLKKGECRFDYSSWEKRLNLTHKVMINSIKMLVKEEYIEQRVRGKKGTQSTYFLTRFLEQNWEQNWEQKKDSNINTLDNIKEQKEERNSEQKKVQSSIYNNLDIISNNNINSSLELKNNSNKQNKTNKKVSEEEINKIWNMYPKKQGKGYAIKKIPNLIKKYGIEQMERCVKRYIDYVENERKTGFKDLQYKNGQTFFNSGYMDYLDENFEEIQKEKSEKENNLILPRKEDDLSF